MKKNIIVCLSLLLIFTTGCSKEGQKRYQAEFLTLFDTVTTIVGYADNKDEFNSLAQKVHDKLQEYHQLFDIYNFYTGINNIKTINDNAGITPVKVDERIISLLLFAKERYEATDGEINVAFGSVLSIWHEYRQSGIDDPENAVIPPISLLQQAAEHCDINNIIINKENSTVYLNDNDMSLDVGAIAKGYAVEQVALLMEKEGYKSLIISVGGNVRAIDGKLNEDGSEQYWNIGIENPDKESSQTELMYVIIKNCSVVTSGVYQRYFTVNGEQYHHIIDKKTLMPSQYFTAVTIICPDSGKADAFSTAIFNMPLDKGLAFINSLSDTEALWVLKDGTLEYSDGFDKYIKVKNAE